MQCEQANASSINIVMLSFLVNYNNPNQQVTLLHLARYTLSVRPSIANRDFGCVSMKGKYQDFVVPDFRGRWRVTLIILCPDFP
jgi:hypothetical protein